MYTPKRLKRTSDNISRGVDERTDNEFEDSTENVGQMSVAKLMQILDLKLSGFYERLAIFEDIIKENQTLKKEIERQKARGDIMEKRLELLENKARRSNLIFYGLEIAKDMNVAGAVSRLCKEKLGVQNVDIQRCFRIGRHEQASTQNILAEFSGPGVVEEVMRNAKKLKGTKVFVQRDCSKEVREKRNKLLRIRAEILRAEAGIKTTVVNDKLHVDKATYNWCNEKGLICGEEDGTILISSKHNIDLRDLVSSILNSSAAKHQNKGKQQRQENQENSC